MQSVAKRPNCLPTGKSHQRPSASHYAFPMVSWLFHSCFRRKVNTVCSQKEALTTALNCGHGQFLGNGGQSSSSFFSKGKFSTPKATPFTGGTGRLGLSFSFVSSSVCGSLHSLIFWDFLTLPLSKAGAEGTEGAIPIPPASLGK